MARDHFAQYQFSGRNPKDAWKDSAKYAHDTEKKFKTKFVLLRFFIFFNLINIIRKKRKSSFK